MDNNVTRLTDKPSVIKFIQKNNTPYVQIGVFDHHGICRGKVLSQKKFLSGLESNLSFCDVIVGADVDDQLCDNIHYTGWHTAYPDAALQVIPDSYRYLPWQPNLPFFLCEFAPSHDAMCCRNLLKRILAKAQDMGYQVMAALEFEFSVFQESAESIREKDYHNLQTLTPGNFGYSILRSNQCHDYYESVLHNFQQLDIPLECLHTEIGPGVLEVAIAVDDALQASDKAALFKTFMKVISERHGLIPTFMAKWNEKQQGHSGHTHMSLTDLKGNPVFYDSSKAHNISDCMRHFIAGQQQLLPELLALCAPTINSFARLVPGHWAPTQATWGVDNRTCALRSITTSATAARVEYRIPGADCNPYLAIAAALASGLYGIEHKLEPTQPISGNAYTQTLNEQYRLPSNLLEASHRLRHSQMAEQWFGKAFIQDFAASREWEVRQYQAAITDWQKRRYFEVI